MPQLDGVRAAAIVLVLTSHFGVFDSVPGLLIPGRFLGGVGVDLFFVLSGFLITGLLLAARERASEAGGSVSAELRRFYARRAFRISPLHYGALAFLALLGVPEVTSELGWHLSYLANWRVAIDPVDLGAVSHFWSLCVEEQFYLVWPSLILMVPRRRLVSTVLALCVIAVVTRAGLFLDGAHAFTIRFNTISCLDSLAMGSLLAILRAQVGQNSLLLRRISFIGFWIGVPGTLAFLFTARSLDDTVYWAFAGLFVAFASAAWVVHAARSQDDVLGSLLSSRPAIAVGRVSYGLYVYHFPVLFWVDSWLETPVGAGETLIRLGLLFSMTAAVATASWWLIERPINGLKRRMA